MPISFTEPNDIIIDKWLGLYSRGANDSVPRGYFTDCLNIDFNSNQVQTRAGTSLDFAKANIVRFFIYRRLNETARYLVLDSSGNFFDSLTPDTPLITNAAYVDFSAVNYLNRAYITFHNRVTGLAATNVYVYQGVGPGTLRQAAGTAPTGFTLGVATSASSGNIAAGTHLAAVAFESDTGFISAPGPTNFTAYIAPGDFAADFNAIPIGPSGTVARWLLLSKATTEYDGNQFGLELFFAVRIGNNTDTTYTALSIFDDDLIDSADYLFDSLSAIPAGLGIIVYNDHLVIWGMNGDPHSVWISKQFAPENFNSISGFLQIQPEGNLSGVQSCVEYRRQLYFAKDPGIKVTVDNGNEPNTWEVDDVDGGVGTTCFGFGTIFGLAKPNTDRLFIADKSGILVFESGILQKPELSWSIKGIWEKMNPLYRNLIQLINDTENNRLICAVPLNGADHITHLIIGDYSEAVGRYSYLVPTQMKWSIWQFPWTNYSISIDNNIESHSILVISGNSGGIYIQPQVNRVTNDDSIKINSYVKLNYEFLLNNYIHQYVELALRVIGSGNLEFNLYGEDDVKIAALNALTLATAPGREYLKKCNFVNEKMSLKMGMTTNIDTYFTLLHLIIRAVPLWATRPA